MTAISIDSSLRYALEYLRVDFSPNEGVPRETGPAR